MNDNLQKGGKGQPIGTRKEFGGREYIKTGDGWKFVGKGNGKGAQKHIEAHKTSSTDNSAPKTHSPEELSNHAADTPTEKLTAVAHDAKASPEMKQAAEQELAHRDKGSEEVKQQHDTPKEEKKKEKKEEPKKEEKPKDTDKKETANKKEQPEKKEKAKPKQEDKKEETSLPNKESEQDSEILAQKNGADKLSEDKEGFSVKVEDRMTESDDSSEEDDINHKFEAFGRFAAGVIKGRMKSLIAYGSGGVGKTYTVTTELEKAGKKIFDPELHDPGEDGYDYVKMTGKMTAAAVYSAMYEHNGKILLFDDCDSVLQDDNAINLFKGALDTSGDGSIDWGSKSKLKDSMGEEIPGKFAFNGRAIFISNLNVGKDQNGKQQNAQLQPIVSRGYSLNLTMDATKTMERIEHIATGKDGKMTNLKFPGTPDYNHEDMKSVLDYMKKHKDKASDLNVRTVGTLLAIKKDADEAGVNWEDDAKYVYLRKSNTIDIYNGNLFNQRKDAIQKSLGVDERSIEDKKIDWCTMKKASFKNLVSSEISR